MNDPIVIAMLTTFLATNGAMAVALVRQRRNGKNHKGNPGNHPSECLMRGQYVTSQECFERTREIMEKQAEMATELGEVKGIVKGLHRGQR